MEALLLSFDVGALIAVFIWAMKNSDATASTTGLFRFKDRLSTQNPIVPQAPRSEPRSRAPR